MTSGAASGTGFVRVIANNLYLDKISVSYFSDLEVKNLYVGKTGEVNPNVDYSKSYTLANIANLKADNANYSTTFGAPSIVGVIGKFYNNEVSNLSVGPNSFVMTGYESQDYGYLTRIMETIDRIGLSDTHEDGKGFKAILYVNDKNGLKIKNGGGITVDGNEETPKVESNTVTLGDYSAIVLSKDLSENALVSGNNIPTISFADGVKGTVKYAEHSRILLDSTTIRAGSSYNIFRQSLRNSYKWL